MGNVYTCGKKGSKETKIAPARMAVEKWQKDIFRLCITFATDVFYLYNKEKICFPAVSPQPRFL